MNDIPQLSGPEVMQSEGDKPDSLVIFAHGYGSNGQDLIGLVPHLQPHLPRTAFVSPNAPETCPGAPGGHQWFALSSLDRSERDKGAYKAAPAYERFIDEQLARFGLTEARVVLCGFSQGTMMSLHVGLRRERQLAGILGFSGLLAAPQMLMEECKSKPPVHLVHGTNDNVLPFVFMFEAKGSLETMRVPVTTHLSQNTAHSIAPDGLESGVDFLKRVLR